MCGPRCFESWRRLLALADGRNDGSTLSRRSFLAASAGSLVATAASAATAAAPNAARDILEATLSFDLHSHPGLFRSMSNDTLDGHRQSAEAGRVKLIALTATSDAPVLAPDRTGRLRATREPKLGELYASMYRQIDVLIKWSAGGRHADGMDGIGPSAIFTSYARWPSLADALLDHGYRPEEVAKILGGNAQRVFQRVSESAKGPAG